jgi:hypothetical protein
MPTFAPESPLLVNSTTTGDQTGLLVARLANGNYVAAWLSSPNTGGTGPFQIVAQLFAPNGTRLGGETVVHGGGSALTGLTALANGSFVVTWQDNSANASGPLVLAQQFDAAGHLLAAPIVVNSTVSPGVTSDGAIALADGGWLEVYNVPSPPQQFAIYDGTVDTQRFDASGNRIGGEVDAGGYTRGSTFAATALHDGGWVLGWNVEGGRYSPTPFANVLKEQFDGAGNTAGPVDLGTPFFQSWDAGQQLPAAATLSNGDYVMVWLDYPNVQAELFDPSGAIIRGPYNLPAPPGGQNAHPQVTALADGGFLVSWLNFTARPEPSSYDTQVLGQYFDAAGRPLGTTLQFQSAVASGTTPFGPPVHWAVTATPDGGFVVETETQNAASGWDVYAQKFDVSGQTVSVASDADDVLVGTSASETLSGFGGNDVLVGNGGNDVLNGGAGLDIAVIPGSVTQVSAYSLAAGTASVTTPAGTDTLQGIERVRFGDALFALDTNPAHGPLDPAGNTWAAALLFHAGFGTLPGIEDLSHWTAQADVSMNMNVLAQKMIDFYAPGISSADLVTYLYGQVQHTTPSAQTVQDYVNDINSGFMTQGGFLVLEATLPENITPMLGFAGTVQQLDPAWFGV